MSAPVPRRVHIAPQGFEDERVYRPALNREADTVVLVEHAHPDPTADDCRERIVEELEAEDVSVEETSCDLFDLGTAIETILTEIQKRPDDHIEVNISAGSKITAVAGMLTCMFTDARPYYVHPEGYNESDGDGQQTLSYGLDEVKFLPAYPFTEPQYQLIEVLSFIYREQPAEGPDGVKLKEIGKFLLEEDLPAVAGSDKDPDQAEDIYPLLHENIINPLLNRRLIDKTRLAGATQIRTTQDGEEMLSLADSLGQR